MREKHKTRLLYLVGGMWALNLGLGMIPPLGYEPSETVNGVFTLVVTTLFVADKVGSSGVKKEEEVEEK